jgi:hypothetical protein
MRIAVLIPVCSRNQPWTVVEDSFLFQAALPSLARTQSPGYEYTYYIGIDDDDSFFLDQRHRIPGIHVLLNGCQHAPATAWNQLFERALKDDHDYYFQMADDVVIETPGWTERFVDALQENGNRGVVGPCHPENYHGRLARGQQYCLENAFVHKTHWDRFGFFYPPEIKNWYCDDWITQVYSGTLSLMMEDVIVRNLSIRTAQQRYEVAVPRWKELIHEHRWRTFRGCFSFCLFEEFTTKYYTGLAKNVELIREHFPLWDIHVYAAPEAVEFVKGLNVHCIETGRGGRVNTLLRFQSVLDTSYDIVCVRDTDSRIHARDRWCIRTFLESPFSLYTIRDHPWHRYTIMCGLWGIKRGRPLFTQKELTDACSATEFVYTSDSMFLNSYLPLHNRLVFSYHPSGLLGDSTETVVVIQHPIEKDEFCGNVVLFDAEGNEYPEFTAQT